MSFMGWNLLIGGSGASQAVKASNDPQHRLTKFKRIFNDSLKIWHNLPSSRPSAATLNDIQTNLQRLTSLLEEDTRAPPPHLCASFATSSFVYTAISRIALTSDNEGVVREAIAIFTILVDNDEDNLLGAERFAETVMNFVDAVLGYNTYTATSETQGEVLELMFGIAAKIRLEPELLPVWFRRSTISIPREPGNDTEQESNEKIDFPLCHQFVGHVYHEGRVGDFARTGLLYMFESASNSAILESWIVDSDLPTLLASGLGALYSQLSRKLQIAYPNENLPLVLALSESDRNVASADTESFYSEDLQARLSTFMSYMIFWQDVLKQCYSPDIKQTLIDHFQVFFLQQILYPSLLESSDADGGSSVAVLTYLWSILNSIEHPDIIDMILGYLLALSEPLDSNVATPRSPIAEKRRLSLLTLSQTDQNEDTMTPSFFNLTDMILASCQSQNTATVTAALRLVNLILTKYHSYALSSLLRTTPIGDLVPSRTVGALNRELDFLIVLAKDAGGSLGMEEAYVGSLKDSLAFIESHVCSRDLFAIADPTNQPRQQLKKRGSMFDAQPRRTQKHTLAAGDPLLKIIVDLLATFFTNTIEVNLGLTNVIAQLASCPLTRLGDWLVRDSTTGSQNDEEHHEYADEEGDVPSVSENTTEVEERLEQQRINAFKEKRSTAAWSASEPSALMKTLQMLAESLQPIRLRIPEFDSLLAGRKRAFQGSTEIENELRELARAKFSPRFSTDRSRDPSSTRPIPVPSMSPKRNSQDGLATSPRGRTLTAIVGQRRSPAASPKSDSAKRPKSLASPVFRSREDSLDSRGSSPSKLSRAMSPLKMAHTLNDDGDETLSNPGQPSVTEEIFERKIQFPVRDRVTIGPVVKVNTEHEDTADTQAQPGTDEPEEHETSYNAPAREATLTHVLTNVVILQEFIMEIAAIIHVRAGLLDGEISFV